MHECHLCPEPSTSTRAELWAGGQCLGTRALVPWLMGFGQPGGWHQLPKPSAAADPVPLHPGLCWCRGVHSCSSFALRCRCYCRPFCTPRFSLLLLFCLTSVNFSSFFPLVLACMNFLYSHSFNNSHVPTPPYPSTTHCSSVVSASRSSGRREAWARGLNLSLAQWELFLIRDHSSLETIPH